MSSPSPSDLTLILSVGGSPQPLATAIEQLRPKRIVFVVSDGSDGSPSSRAMVEQAEITYDHRTGQIGPGLAHHPACPADRVIVDVPPDDLDRALARIDDRIAREVRFRPVTVDYTGGTKTMTAAMVLAATAYPGVRLQFMAGKRSDLSKVAAGTEAAVEMPGDLVGMGRAFTMIWELLGRRQYGAALAVAQHMHRDVARLSRRVPGSWARRVNGWVRVLSVLDAWDRFDHAGAFTLLDSGLEEGASWAMAFEASGLASRLERLAECAGKPNPELTEDLWLNAHRRAENGLYDDAVARLYRLAEAAVQSRLWLHHGIDTGQVDAHVLSAPIAANAPSWRDRRTGREYHRLSLTDARRLLAELERRDPFAPSWPIGMTPKWQSRRNRSILAHGFSAMTREDWQEARNWFMQRRGVLWEDLLGRPTLDQLPNQWQET